MSSKSKFLEICGIQKERSNCVQSEHYKRFVDEALYLKTIRKNMKKFNSLIGVRPEGERSCKECGKCQNFVNKRATKIFFGDWEIMQPYVADCCSDCFEKKEGPYFIPLYKITEFEWMEVCFD